MRDDRGLAGFRPLNQSPWEMPILIGKNRYLSRMLWDKGIRHALHEWDGRAHQGYHWRRMAPLYL
ncbi:hypothetical protein Atep_27470 [Allochromatium tepidum]|uniref:Uncharacterized protein n=1 Tax=Allochromatium tepidum TaxID=553982 RepID=A0ABM7QQ77_9GAMM|nr:hypothetical protein Atep_27470 [Allochromatium tepidum]